MHVLATSCSRAVLAAAFCLSFLFAGKCLHSMADSEVRLYEHAFVALTWAWEDPLPPPSAWLPLTEMQNLRIRDEWPVVWLKLNNRHKEFHLLVIDGPSGLRLYENRGAARRVIVRRVGGQVNISVHASHLVSRGIVRPLALLVYCYGFGYNEHSPSIT